MKNHTIHTPLAALLALSTLLTSSTALAGDQKDLAVVCDDLQGLAVGSCDNIPGATLVITTPPIDGQPGNPCQEIHMGVIFDFFGTPFAVAMYKLMPSSNPSKPGVFEEESEGPVSTRHDISESYWDAEGHLHLSQVTCVSYKLEGFSECSDPIQGVFTREGDTITLVGDLPSGNCTASY